MEIQALVAPSGLATPRRAVVGWDGSRLAMLLAVLEARCGLVMSTRDVYLNVAGGLRVQEPAADLAVAAAIISSELGHPAPPAAVFFGEVGLAGEVRAVGHGEARLKEAAKAGLRAGDHAALRQGVGAAACARTSWAGLTDLVAAARRRRARAATRRDAR